MAAKGALEMTPDYVAPSIPPRNALLAGAPQAAQQPPQPSVNLQGLLANAIGHAALLSDTPARWESTIAMLKQNGVDPHGFEDFEKGRPAAMAAAGMAAQQDQGE
jgi:hypothetical protein